MELKNDDVVIQLRVPRALVFQLDAYLAASLPEAKQVIPTPYEWAKTTEEGRIFFEKLTSKEYRNYSSKELSRMLFAARDEALGVKPKLGRPPLNNLREDYFVKCIQSTIVAAAEQEQMLQPHDSRIAA